MEYNFIDIGERIRTERKSKGWTQYDLLNELSTRNININRNTLSDLENGIPGKKNINIELFAVLCEFFNCDMGYLLCEYDCKTEINQDISAKTGLTDHAINALKYMSAQDMLIANSIIERGDVILLRYAIQNYFRHSYQKISIRGLGMESDLDGKESIKIFEYLSNSFLNDIFNSLIHDEQITNAFMRSSASEFLDAFENAVEETNSMYEQTPERKEFMKKTKETFNKHRRKNQNTDYYSQIYKK